MGDEVRRTLIFDFARVGYTALRTDWSTREPQDVYSRLFPIAVDYRADSADGIAAQLLVEIEPRCPVSCEEALLVVAAARWQVSDERVPFYLLCQFGRRDLFSTVARLLGRGDLGSTGAMYVDTVAYWARLPTMTLAERLKEYVYHGGPAAG